MKTSETHNDGLVLLGGVSDDDALYLLVQALHAVAETRSRRLGYGDGNQNCLGQRRLHRKRTTSETELERFSITCSLNSSLFHLLLKHFKPESWGG